MTVLVRRGAGVARLEAAEELAPTPGFIGTLFPAAALELARRSLATVAPLPRPAAVVLAARRFDEASLRRAKTSAARGQLSPLMFHQTVATATAGAVTIHLGLDGPMVCLAVPPGADEREAAVAVAADMVATGDAAAVIVIAVATDPQGQVSGSAEVLVGEHG